MLYDHDLSIRARMVYAELAMSVFQGDVARIGQRLIAAHLGMSRRSIREALTELVDREHVAMTGETTSRRWYKLTSPVFAQKQAAGIEEVASSPSGGKRLVSVASA